MIRRLWRRLFGGSPSRVRRVRPELTWIPFAPLHSPDGKENFKRYYRIEKDGSVIERIMLDCPTPEQREEIILKHYLSYLGQQERRGFKYVTVVSRDDPWDFRIRFSNEGHLNVEITSIAESEWLFEKLKREERFRRLIGAPKATIRELEKVAGWFGDERLADIIEQARKEGGSPDDTISNPLFADKGRIFLSDTKKESESLSGLILDAVDRKESKRHKDKEDTVLIIENRTVKFGQSDLVEAMEKISREGVDTSFREVLFYTGYYSRIDGRDAEFNISVLQQWKD